jgi:hypothetical protein
VDFTNADWIVGSWNMWLRSTQVPMIKCISSRIMNCAHNANLFEEGFGLLFHIPSIILARGYGQCLNSKFLISPKHSSLDRYASHFHTRTLSSGKHFRHHNAQTLQVSNFTLLESWQRKLPFLSSDGEKKIHPQPPKVEMH